MDKVIVIGSSGYDLSDECTWNNVPNLEDYKVIIVNVASLNRKTIDKIMEKDPKKFLKMRKELVDVANSGGLIVCITNKNDFELGNFYQYSTSSSRYESTNYSWCPIFPIFLNKTGERLKSFTEDNKKYLKNAKKYSHYLEKIDTSWLRNHYGKPVSVTLDSIVTNLTGKKIAFLANWNIIVQAGVLSLSNKGKIYFYPPPTEICIKDGIDMMLKNILGRTSSVDIPDWVDQEVEFPNEKKILKQISKKEENIKKESEKLKRLRKKLGEEKKFKALVTESGLELEILITDALGAMGIEIVKADPYEEDRIYKTETGEIKIEIKGKRKIGYNDISGLITRRFQENNCPSGYKAAGVLIVNHDIDKKLSERRRLTVFPSNVVKNAKKADINLITTEEILDFLIRYFKGEDITQELKDKLFNKIGYK